MYKTLVLHTRSTYWTAKESGEELLVDADDLSEDMENKMNEMSKKNYELVSITPVNSGNFSNGNGYLHTESIILTFKKNY